MLLKRPMLLIVRPRFYKGFVVMLVDPPRTGTWKCGALWCVAAAADAAPAAGARNRPTVAVTAATRRNLLIRDLPP